MSNYDDEITVFDNQEQMEFAILLSYNSEEAKDLPVLGHSKAGHPLVIDLGNFRGYLAPDADGAERLSWLMLTTIGGNNVWKLIAIAD